MKERPILFAAPMVRAILAGTKTQTRRIIKPQPAGQIFLKYGCWNSVDQLEPWTCHQGQPGDRLWVRETFSVLDDGIQKPMTVYRADMHGEDEEAHHKPWKPCIFMHRHESRISLEITEVRAQCLQDMTEEDAKAEGVEFPDYAKALVHDDGRQLLAKSEHGYRTAFIALWDSLNAKRGYGWYTNPWVWAITFKRRD